MGAEQTAAFQKSQFEIIDARTVDPVKRSRRRFRDLKRLYPDKPLPPTTILAILALSVKRRDRRVGGRRYP